MDVAAPRNCWLPLSITEPPTSSSEDELLLLSQPSGMVGMAPFISASRHVIVLRTRLLPWTGSSMRRRASRRRREVPWSCGAASSQLDLLCWTVAQCLTHRAQGASDGRRARRLAESRPEPARASLLVRRNSWSQLVATSRQAARRDEHPRGLRPARRLRCCGGTAEQVRAAVAGPWLGHRPTPRTLANRCSCSALSQIRKTTTFEPFRNSVRA